MSLYDLWNVVSNVITTQTGILLLNYKMVVMWCIAFFFLYLAVVKQFEPLLLLPIGFGILVVNFPLVPIMGYNAEGQRNLIEIFYHYGLEWEVIPCLIFLGLGALTDFGPLIANPKTLIVGAGAQLGVFVTFIGVLLCGFTLREAASVGIIGGADGPTTIYLTTKLAPHLLGANALAAYSYMAMVPLIQPPIVRMMIRKKDRLIRMPQLRTVSRMERIIYPLIVYMIIAILVPAVSPLMGMFMFGNLMRESGVVKSLTRTAGGPMMDVVTILLGVSVGASMQAEVFLSYKPLMVFGLGLLDFVVCTAGGIITVKIINLFVKNKINPIIGISGVSAIPMSPRVAQVWGQKYNPQNYLLMHAMGACLAGSIGSPAAAGMLLAMFE